MRILMALLLTVALFAGGCAKQQESYQQAVLATNEMALASVTEQAKSNADRRQQSMVFFSQAMVEASKTEDPTDNAVIAFAWGFQSGTPDTIQTPNLKFPEKPSDGVDYMRAGLPYFNVVWPWLWGAYGDGGSSGSGQRITADNGGTVILDSGNAGSYNQASKGGVVDASNSVINDSSTNLHAGRDNNYNGSGGSLEPGADGECPAGYTLRLSTGTCITEECEAIIDATGDDSCDGGVPPVGITGGGESCEDTGGYFNSVNGKYYADEFFTCSCGSRAAGEC